MYCRKPVSISNFSLHRCKILIICWIFGLVFGIAFSYCSQSFSSWMHIVLRTDVSIVGTGAVCFLPFLLTAFAVLISKPGALFSLAFLKAFSYGACAAAADITFGASGWMIRILLMFSDGFSLVVMFWLWLKCFDEKNKELPYYFVISFVLLVLIGSIDYLVIAPFLASVI